LVFSLAVFVFLECVNGKVRVFDESFLSSSLPLEGTALRCSSGMAPPT
jgi:hypothetical protein